MTEFQALPWPTYAAVRASVTNMEGASRHGRTHVGQVN
jgi:hypothetical protein